MLVTWKSLIGPGPDSSMDYPQSNCSLPWELALTLSLPLSTKGGGKCDLMPYVTCANQTLSLYCISWTSAQLPWAKNDSLGGMIVFFWKSSHLYDPFFKMKMFFRRIILLSYYQYLCRAMTYRKTFQHRKTQVSRRERRLNFRQNETFHYAYVSQIPLDIVTALTKYHQHSIELAQLILR